MLFGTSGLRRLVREKSKEQDDFTEQMIRDYKNELLSETSHSSKRGFIRSLVRLAKPYYWSQDNMKEKAVAWGLLATTLALTYLQVTEVAVGFNDWNREVGDYIQESFDAASRGTDALNEAWNGFMGHMTDLGILTGKLLGVGYANYKLGQYAVLRWRKWMTEDYEKKYLDSQTYYHMQNKSSPLDNPDQRIQEDPAKVADFAFDIVNDAFDAGMSLVTFSAILWGLSETVTIAGMDIPKFMFTAVMAYAALGTAITYAASKPIDRLTQRQQEFEADYRSDLKELHEKREAIALNGAEDVQKGVLRESFNRLYENSKKLININSSLLVLRVAYNRLAGAVPLAVSFPQVVAGKMQMGGIFQVSGAFGEVKNALSWYVNNATKIRAGTAYMNRLIDIDDELTAVQLEQRERAEQSGEDIPLTEVPKPAAGTRKLGM